MNKTALKNAMDNLSILMIYLHKTSAYIDDSFDPIIPNQELIAQFKIGVKYHAFKEVIDKDNNKHDFLIYKTEARMRYLRSPLPETIENDEQLDQFMVSEIIAEFASEYAIRSESRLDDDSIVEFGRINVPHQVWPYWREFCQSTCARMSLPIFVLPMHSINGETEKEFESSDS